MGTPKEVFIKCLLYLACPLFPGIQKPEVTIKRVVGNAKMVYQVGGREVKQPDLQRWWR